MAKVAEGNSLAHIGANLDRRLADKFDDHVWKRRVTRSDALREALLLWLKREEKREAAQDKKSGKLETSGGV